jgi:hypothetical protein
MGVGKEEVPLGKVRGLTPGAERLAIDVTARRNWQWAFGVRTVG